MAENRLTVDYAAGAPGNLQIAIPRALQDWWNNAQQQLATPTPVIPQGPGFVAPKSPEQLAADQNYTAGAPGNVDLGAFFRPAPGAPPPASVVDGYWQASPLVKPTEPFKVDPSKDVGAVAALKEAGNTVWNAPGYLMNAGPNMFNSVSGPWFGDKAIAATVGPVVNSIGDFFTKTQKQADADRLAPIVPQRLDGIPFNPQAAVAGVDPRWAQASKWSGGVLSPEYFARTIGKESGGNNNARNPNSTATGPGQFTEGTFLGILKSSGGVFGLPPQVIAQIDPKMPDGPLRRSLLALRTDPTASDRATAILGRINFDVLGRNLNRQPTEDEVYLAHLLGPTAATAIIKAPPNAPATAFVSRDAAVANPTLFFRDGRPRTAGEFRQQQSTQWQAASGQPSDLSFSTTLPAPPQMLPVQQTPPPIIAPMPGRPTPTAVDYAPVQDLIAGGRPQQVLTPQDIEARKKAIVLQNILSGLARGFIPGALAGYGKGKQEALAFDQGLRQGAEGDRADWSRWAVSPTGQVQEGVAANANNLADSLYQSSMDTWNVDRQNADRQWESQNANSGALVGTQNQNAQNTWKWKTDVATAGGVQNLGNGALMVTEGDPTSGQVTQRVVDASAYMAGLRRQGGAFGAFSGANVPAPVKARIGAMSVAATQGPDAMWMVAADEIADSPMADRILGSGAEALRKQAESEGRGDARRTGDIFRAKIAAALALKAQQDPNGLRSDLAQANQLGIVSAGAILGYSGQ